jgi:hypothetical protein
MGEPGARARYACGRRPLANSRPRLRLWLRGPAQSSDADCSALAAVGQRRCHGRAHQGSGELLRHARSSRDQAPAHDCQTSWTRSGLACQAVRRRGRQPHRSEPAQDGRPQRLLPATRGGARRVGAVRCQWEGRASARLQRAVDGALQAEPVALWRRGAPCRVAGGPCAGDGLCREAGRPSLRAQGARLCRFHDERRRAPSARNQSPPRRHARHLR